MSPELRSEGLAAAARVERDALLSLADEFARGAAVEVLDAPAAGSIIVRLSTAVGSFYFSEVVVTTARVRAGGGDGWGCVLGWDAEAALAAALCDARACERTLELAQRSLSIEEESRTARSRRIARTKV